MCECREAAVGLACAGRSLALVEAHRDRASRVARPLCTGRCPSCAELLEVWALHSCVHSTFCFAFCLHETCQNPARAALACDEPAGVGVSCISRALQSY